MREERGFTLIETVLALAVLGLVTAAVFIFYYSGVTAWHKGVSRMDYQQNARAAVDLIDRELRFACWLEILREEEIRFKIKGDPGQEDLQHFRCFRLSGDQLIMEEIRNGRIHAYNVVALDISEIVFSLDDFNNVHIYVTAGGAGDAVTLESSVTPRNLQKSESPWAERGENCAPGAGQ